MTSLKDFLKAASSEKEGGPLREILGDAVDIGTMGPYPLSTMTNLTDSGVDTPFESGEIRIEFTDVVAKPLKITNVMTSGDDTSGEMIIQLGAMELNGHYHLFAIDQPNVDIDSGGSLLPLESLGGSESSGSLTPTEYEQLCQAREQREKLKKTANGQKLVHHFSKYNDIYNKAFQTIHILQHHWKADGATSQMATHTSSAITSDDYVNPKGATYGSSKNKVGYNDNAYSQKGHVMAACLGLQMKYTMENKPKLAALSGGAASHAVSFGMCVNKNTNNTQSNTNQMKPSHVYKSVNNPTHPNCENDQTASQLFEAYSRIVKNEHNDEDISFLRSEGYTATDKHIRAMQEIYEEAIRQQKPEHNASLWHGDFSSSLSESMFELSFHEHEGGVISTSLIRQKLSFNNLAIDDENWSGEAGDLARNRLSSALFIDGLITSRISNYVEQKIAAYVFDPSGDSGGQ